MARVPDPACGARRDRRVHRLDRPQRRRQHRAAQHQHRLLVPRAPGRIRDRAEADRRQRERDLLRRLSRGAAQHRGAHRDRDPVRDRARLRHRARAALQQSARGGCRRGLCRDRAQRAAAAAAVLLVLRGAAPAAQSAPIPEFFRHRVPQQARAVPPLPGVPAGLRGARLDDRGDDRRRLRARVAERAPPRAHRHGAAQHAPDRAAAAAPAARRRVARPAFRLAGTCPRFPASTSPAA